MLLKCFGTDGGPPVLVLQALPQLLELAHQVAQLLAQRRGDGRARALAAAAGAAALSHVAAAHETAEPLCQH